MYIRWKKSDYMLFNQDATRDINLLMKFENCDMQTAKDLLYQSYSDNGDVSKRLLPKHAVQRQRNDGLIKRSKAHPLIRRGTLEIMKKTTTWTDLVTLQQEEKDYDAIIESLRKEEDALNIVVIDEATDVPVNDNEIDEVMKDEVNIKASTSSKTSTDRNERIPKLPPFVHDLIMDKLFPSNNSSTTTKPDNKPSIELKFPVKESYVLGLDNSNHDDDDDLENNEKINADLNQRSPLQTFLAIASTFALAAFALTDQG